MGNAEETFWKNIFFYSCNLACSVLSDWLIFFCKTIMLIQKKNKKNQKKKPRSVGSVIQTQIYVTAEANLSDVFGQVSALGV